MLCVLRVCLSKFYAWVMWCCRLERQHNFSCLSFQSIDVCFNRLLAQQRGASAASNAGTHTTLLQCAGRDTEHLHPFSLSFFAIDSCAQMKTCLKLAPSMMFVKSKHSTMSLKGLGAAAVSIQRAIMARHTSTGHFVFSGG